MISSSTYEYLTKWLAEAMEAEYKSRFSKSKETSLRGYGRFDKSYWPSREKNLRSIVRQLICNDKTKRFLAEENGQSLYVFNGLCFVQIEKGEVFLMELFKRTFKALEIGDWYNDECPAKAIAKSCFSTLTSSDEYQYRPNKRYVCFTNGVFDLKDGKLKAAKIEYCPQIVLDIEFKDKDTAYRECAEKYGMNDNPCRLWDKKIVEILPNKEVRDAFQQWCGSLLLDHAEFKQEFVAYLIGPGANGKSVLANVIVNLFGERYFSRFTMRQLFKDDYRNNRANLRGKIANFIDDLDEKHLGGEDFKSIASGALLEARELYAKRTFKVAAPPILCCTNSMPESDDDSYGHHRRQLPLHTTTHQFTGEERDPKLTYKLSTDEARCYLFSWVYDGFRKVRANEGNIKLGNDVIKAQEILMDSSNSMRLWWRDNNYIAVEQPEKEDARWRSLADLHEEYKAYALESGYENYKRNTELSAMIRSKGFVKDVNEKRFSGGTYFCIDKKTQ